MTAVRSMDADKPLLGHKKSSGFLEIAIAALRISSTPVKVPSSGLMKTDLKGQDDRHGPIFTLDQVSYHDQPDDCWLIIYDRVYDVTEFLSKHPGGSDIMLEYAGRDASMAFRGVGHTTAALNALEKYKIGQLPQSECIFRTSTGLRLSGIPD